MSLLTLVRHGQAQPFDEASDRLSELGTKQSYALGMYWAGRRAMWNEAWSGTLERQRKTAEAVAACYRKAGFAFPAVQYSDAFNEYSVPIPPDAMRQVRLAAEDQKNRIFQSIIEEAISAWKKTPEFAMFHHRVTVGLKQLIHNKPSQSRIVVFTSGGPIGVAVQSVLCAPAQQAIEINWRVRNCSLTEFIFSGSRISLDRFNATPHLVSDEMQSFR
jgi:broad specificity phosphatase PhoE